MQQVRVWGASLDRAALVGFGVSQRAVRRRWIEAAHHLPAGDRRRAPVGAVFVDPLIEGGRVHASFCAIRL